MWWIKFLPQQTYIWRGPDLETHMIIYIYIYTLVCIYLSNHPFQSHKMDHLNAEERGSSPIHGRFRERYGWQWSANWRCPWWCQSKSRNPCHGPPGSCRTRGFISFSLRRPTGRLATYLYQAVNPVHSRLIKHCVKFNTTMGSIFVWTSCCN